MGRTGMAYDVDRLLALWETPLSARDDPEADFRALYTDPTVVNGVTTSVRDLVARAAALQAAFPARTTELLDHTETGDRLVIAFVMRARHEGPLQTALGTVPGTGRDVAFRTIDVLTLTDGRISNIWVTADELDLLRQLDAVELRPEPVAGQPPSR